MNYTIGRNYRYPKGKKKFKLKRVTETGNIFVFECGHWCTDCMFEDLIDTVTGIQVIKNLQTEIKF